MALLIFLAIGLVVHQDDAAARPAQALVRGRGDDVGVRHRVRIDAGGDQAGVVRHVDHEAGADVLGHLGEALEVDAQAVRRRAGDDQLGPVLVGQALHRVVVDLLGRRQAVAHHLEPLAAHVERHAVGQVAAFGQAHAHDGVAGLEQAEEHGLVGLRAGVRLHVGVAGAEQLLDAVDGQLLDDVDELAAAVVALAGIALGVLVGELACPAPPSPRARRSSRRRSARCALPGAGSRAGSPRRSRGRRWPGWRCCDRTWRAVLQGNPRESNATARGAAQANG